MFGNTESWFGVNGPVCSSANQSLPGADCAWAPCSPRERFNQSLDKLLIYTGLSWRRAGFHGTMFGFCLWQCESLWGKVFRNGREACLKNGSSVEMRGAWHLFFILNWNKLRPCKLSLWKHQRAALGWLLGAQGLRCCSSWFINIMGDVPNQPSLVWCIFKEVWEMAQNTNIPVIRTSTKGTRKMDICSCFVWILGLSTSLWYSSSFSLNNTC